MRIGVLTSSRADFGIYLPLLKALKEDPFFNLDIIAFGTHLSRFHGYTLGDIHKQGFEVKYQIPSLMLTDDAQSISSSYALTSMKFADFWQQHQTDFDLVFCLGDRFEMAAAVVAGVPFSISFAHIHGGETTIGAIDNIYRHTISLCSKYHFVSTELYAQRVKEITGCNQECYVVGALSLNNLGQLQLLTKDEFRKQWNIDVDIPSILITIHPETVDFGSNNDFANESLKALLELSETHQLIITMPNADTSGTIYRKMFERLKTQKPEKVHLIENFGSQSYFTCMEYTDFLLGNSSSGIIEAASLGKYVIDIGDRQKGRAVGENVVNVPFKSEVIVQVAKQLAGKKYTDKNIYYRENSASQIVKTLKEQIH